MDSVVSVIIPTRNRRDYLEQALDSVHSQSYGNWEIIVVDDASDDGTWEWLQGQQESSMRCVRLAGNSGSTVTRNKGLRMARGDTCLFLDDDDLLPPDALAMHTQAIESVPGAIATLGCVMNFNEKGAAGRMRPAERRCLRDDIWREVHFLWSYLVGASLFRKSALERIGGFDESLTFYGDDTNLWIRLGHLGSVVLIPEDVIHFRLHGQKRPDDFWQFQTRLREQQAALLAPKQRRLAERIHRARAAFYDLRHKSGSPGHAGRVVRLVTALSRCPFLLTSPLTAGPIRSAIRGR